MNMVEPPNTDLPFWTKKWEINQIGFHRNEVGYLFNKYVLFKLANEKEQQQSVLFPLCGKTLDMKAVLDAGHRVIGIEGSRMAVEQFFQENQIAFETKSENDYELFQGTDRPVTIYVMNFFQFKKLAASSLPIDYIWDRGGLVAVTPNTREEYRDLLLDLMTPGRTQLYLDAIYYDDPILNGPPHRLMDDQVKELFGSKCSIELLEVYDITDEYNERNPTKTVKFLEERLHLIVRK